MPPKPTPLTPVQPNRRGGRLAPLEHTFTPAQVHGLLTGGVPPSAIRSILATHRSPEQWHLSAPDTDEELAWRGIDAIDPGCDAVVWGQPGYPYPLYALSDAPPLLYLRGAPSVLGPGVGVVGSRNMTQLGEIAATVATLAALDLGAPVVSGLASGVDECAHNVALANSIPTIGVLGCGLDALDERNAELTDRIVAAGGVVCTEQAPDCRTSAPGLVARNRIIAALASPLVVCEAGLRSGSMHAARFAAQTGSPLIVPLPRPGHRNTPGAEGLLALAGPPERLVSLGWPAPLAARLSRRGAAVNGVCATREELVQAISLFWWLRPRSAEELYAALERVPVS